MKDAALHLVNTIAAAVGEVILVTASPNEAGAAVGDRPVVLVNPPEITHVTRHIREMSWSIAVISNIRDFDDAWPQLDQLLDEIAPAVLAETSSYGSYQPPHGDPWPCIVIDTTTTAQPF